MQMRPETLNRSNSSQENNYSNARDLSQEALWRLQLAAAQTQTQQIYVEQRSPSAFSGLVDYAGYPMAVPPPPTHITTVTSSLSQQSFVQHQQQQQQQRELTATQQQHQQPLMPHEMLQAAQRYGTLRKSKQPPQPPQRKDQQQQHQQQQQQQLVLLIPFLCSSPLHSEHNKPLPATTIATGTLADSPFRLSSGAVCIELIYKMT
ncbi:hypothetical protein ACLKA6_005548 [Drosophila palustris]